MLETGAKCDGTTDDTTAINAAFATDNKHITIPAGKTCYSATGVTMPANVELSGGSFAFSYPEDVPNNTSMIQCAKDVAACLTIETSPSYGGGMVRNLAVSTDATHASPPTTGACIKINDGYNVTLESVGVFECYDGYYWNGRAGLQIAGFMSHAFSGAIVDAHVVQDTTPELRIQWSRFGINGAQDYHSAAFIRETGGLASQAGILPKRNFRHQHAVQPRRRRYPVDHLLEFMNCLSCGPTPHQNGSEAWIFAQRSRGKRHGTLSTATHRGLSLYGLQFANNLMAASGEAFALNAATAVVNLDLANNELVAGTFHFNSSAAMPSNSLITGNDFIGSVTIDNQYVASKLSVMNFIGNSINQNVTLQGGWKKLNFIGNAWGGTFTNTAKLAT